MTQDDVILLLVEQITKAGSLRKLADKWGLSAAYISDIGLGRRLPGPKVLKKLGLKVTKQVTRIYELAARQKGKQS